MTMKQRLCLSVAAVGVLAFAAAASGQVGAQTAVAIDADDIGGVVTGANGPEAGVCVIAETTDRPTRYAKMVVTDDQGRYVLPDLPKAKYKVWVRGYGLVDSPKVDGEPGQQLNLRAVPAPNEAAAAQYYPAIYWYSMLKIPDKSEFGGKSNIPEKLTQVDWLKQTKNIGCIGCHQLGQQSTRTIPAAFGEFKSGEEAWMRRIQSGQSGEQMTNQLAGNFGGAPFKYYGDWTDRIAKGELPKSKPPRPQGVERNVVITSWEWGTDKQYLHDLISSDRRNPTVNAYGPLYGSPEYSTDNMPILDPKTSKVTFFKMPVEDPNMPESLGPGHAASIKPLQASAYWGDEKTWDTRANNHNAMFDKKGRVWIAATVRGMDNPAFCKKGSDHPSAKVFPLERSPRQVAMLDPKTMKYTFVDTCFGTHHPQFGYDANDTLWLSGTGPVAGWINTKMFDETGDAAKSQGWSPFILDPNATGDHCPEGWSFYKYPGPGFEGIGDNSAESSYYTWVDQHNTLGLGENVPISTANLNDGFVALKDGQMVMLRIPYPMGFYAKGFDGRIDDPSAGWKGRGLWSSSGDRTPWLMEGGKGSKPRAVHIQLRPDPLAH